MLANVRILYYLLFILFFSKCRAKNYCDSSYCNNTKQHVLCKFQNADPARHCLGYEKTINSAKEKQAILDKLNSRRNKVAGGEIRSLPAAERMMKLEWNEELELSAQRWADQCVKHRSPDNKDSCRDLGSVFVEQSIATISGESPGLTPVALVDVWYMELLNINASVLKRYQRSKNAGYSHYDYFTQLVWANTKQVGCGGVKFKERLQDYGNDKKRTVYRLVCNFAPGGNIVNQTVYDDGPPCSKCPDGVCDSVYTALCNSNPPISKPTERTEFDPTTNIFRSKIAKGLIRTEKNTISPYKTDISPSSENDHEDNITPFDYYPHIHDYVRPTLATTTKPASSCKDVLDVDDFVELLKRKLSTDPMFKDLLQSTVATTEHTINGFTDALAILGKIYSKSMPSTTTKPSVGDYFNSTLLVDLVEAVIFRNSNKLKFTDNIIKTTIPESYVSPVKIQAELAEIRENADFTGHLFFPEDVEDGGENTESTEHYYDMTYPSISEFEIHDFKRSKATKDFLEDILDAETATEKSDDFKTITAKQDSQEHRWKRETFQNEYYLEDRIVGVPKTYKKYIQSDCAQIVLKYSELLKKLASDIKLLNLNERFYCAGNFSHKCYHCTILITLFVILNIRFYLMKLL